MTDADLLALLLINARLQTMRAGPMELLCAQAFGRVRLVPVVDGEVELRTWRGRSYFWRSRLSPPKSA